jgi:hypothetical protein
VTEIVWRLRRATRRSRTSCKAAACCARDDERGFTSHASTIESLQQTRWDAVMVQEHGALTGLDVQGREQWVMPYARESHAAIARAGARSVSFVICARTKRCRRARERVMLPAP